MHRPRPDWPLTYPLCRKNTDRSKDPQGHGTGESANIFALAPEAVLQPIRASNNSGDLVGAMTGFLRAKELQPKIISCSWGGDQDYPPDGQPDASELAFAAEIQDAISQGILVDYFWRFAQAAARQQARPQYETKSDKTDHVLVRGRRCDALDARHRWLIRSLLLVIRSGRSAFLLTC
jgi:hypothetical protein